MESVLTHKEAIQAWHEGVTAFDCGNNEKALEILLQIPQNSTTARILYNIGHIYLILNQYAEAAKNFEAAFEKDVHLAAAFYQCGVALYQDNKFNNARKMFEKSKECLRESQYIDYKALGMTCRLYKCEILLNLSIAVAAMTKDPEWALDILTEADKCQREKNHIQVIQSAKIKLQDGLIPTIFSLPQKEIFRPPKDKIENLSKKDYLGQAKVVHAVPGSSIKKLSKPKEEKILDLPSPGQKRHSLQPPTRTAPAPNTFKPINTLNHRVSPTPPNRLPPSPTSPFSRPHSNSPRRISTPSPTPPCRPPPSAPGLSNSNVDRLTPSPTPPMRLPPSVPDSNRGRPSPSSSPPPKFFPQSHERSNSGGKGPPIRPPPVSPSKLSTGDSSHSSSVDSRGPSPNKLSHKDTIVIWHEAMLIYQTGNVSEALDKLLSIPEPTAKILFNIGSMQLLTNDVVNATKTFEAAVEKDEHMAIGFFQHGIALARQSEYQLAWDAFDKARRALRKNDSIDYKQIGLPYKLYECEVLNNQSLMYMYLGDQELAKKVLELALKKKAEVRHSKIDAAMDKLKASSVFDLFTLPKDAVFKPPASKVENIKKVDYLGQKKVVAKFEERDLTSRPIKLTPRLSMDLSGIPLSSTNPNGEAYRRSSSPGINITHHGSLGNENVDVFTNVTDDNEFEDNRCYSPPAIDENEDSDTDTYGPIPESLRAPSPGPPTRPAPTPPIQQIWERKDSLGPPIRDAPSPPHPLKPENEETELYTNFPAKNNNTVYNSSHLSPTNKKPLPLPKPTRF